MARSANRTADRPPQQPLRRRQRDRCRIQTTDSGALGHETRHAVGSFNFVGIAGLRGPVLGGTVGTQPSEGSVTGSTIRPRMDAAFARPTGY